MHFFRHTWISALVAALLLPQLTAAQPAARVRDAHVPQALAPWLPWVLGDAPELVCPVRDGAPLCLWPGRLTLDLAAQGGSFSLEVWLDRPGLVPLPGSGASWPLDVQADGRALPVVAQAERPSCELTTGQHRITGRFRWPRLPETLAVPAQVARIGLSLNGQGVEQPRRDEAGSLWLQARAGGDERQALELRVTRALRDGVPPRLDTSLSLRVAGAAREVDLGQVLPEGSVPLSITAELPARLDASGRLRLQVRAGSFQVQIGSRFTRMPEKLGSGARPAPWPAQEVWVFQADERLRQVELSGARAVDPAQVELEPAFRGLPTFLVQPADVLQLKTVRRGDPEPVPDEVHLQRALWLDEDGTGYSVQDQLSGELHTSTRLDLVPYALGRASVDGQDQLITRVRADAPGGVELRSTALALQADYRIERAPAELPAVGWSSDVRSLGILLHLPPGFELLGASGVDRVDHSWISDWDLFGFFYVLIVALGAARVAGRWFGVVAFAALAVSYQEADAPGPVWLALIACVALLQHLKHPAIQRVARGLTALTALTLLLQGVPFAARSLREALYPQLAQAELAPPPMAAPAAPSLRAAARERASEAAKAAEEALIDSVEGGRGSYSAYGDDLAKKPGARKAGPEDPESVVQTGPGLPDWQWRSHQLSWSGPVQRDHRFSLWLAPPWLTRLVSVLRVLLLALLAWGLARALPKRPAASSPPLAAAAIALLLCLCTQARADFPDPALLGELKARAVRIPECRPGCLSIGELALRVDGSGLTMEAQVHALDATSVRLPGPAASWLPEQVKLDGADAALRVHEDGFVHARVLPGVHRLQLRGRLPAQDVLTLRLGDRPAQLSLQVDGYEVQGVREDGSVGDSLELKRLLRAGPGADSEPQSLPAWLTVTRELDLGYTWQLHTRVKRETPTGSAVVVHVPLLAGEAVHDARVQVQGSEAIVSLGPDDAELSFASSLAQRDAIELRAPTAERYAEVWQLRCGSSWQCEATGLAPVSRESEGHSLATYRPWPEERLRIALRKPQAAQGQSATIDSAQYRIVPGIRQSEGSLQLHVRASRASVQRVELPEGARVRGLSLNGQAHPVHNSGRSLQFNLQPGATDVVLGFEHPSGMQRVYDVPRLALGMPLANARLTVAPPSDAWLLWISGPAWGPAILFWGYLGMCLLAALLLGRAGGLPLARHEWLLLAAGLTQVDTVEALFVVGFFFAFALRARTTTLTPLWHDLSQLALVLLTLVAASALFDAVRHGLLVQPEMQIAGPGSGGGELTWYVDRTQGAFPAARVLSLPLWVYRGLMLLWALWLASRLLRWVPWAFSAFGAGGLWKRKPKPAPAPPPAAVSGSAETPAAKS